jgi:hypothetical protein
MRKEYGKVLREEVEKRMSGSRFGWKLHREKSMYVFPGERTFRKDVSPQLTLWCIFAPNQKFESFTVEVGWSRLSRFPQLTMRPCLERPAEAHGKEEYTVRLGTLIDGSDLWWEVEPFKPPRNNDELLRMMQPIPADKAKARVLPKVDEALAALERHGEPYLEQIAKHTG